MAGAVPSFSVELDRHRALLRRCVGLLLEERQASAPALALAASKSSLGHSEPASGIMGMAHLHQVGTALLLLRTRLYCHRCLTILALSDLVCRP